MYRLLAIAKYDERYVIPTAHAEQAHALEELATECSLDYDGGPGMGGSGPFGEGSGGADADRGGELPHAQGAPDRRHRWPARRTRRGRVNLLNWDGKGAPRGPVPAEAGATGRSEPRRPTRRSRRSSTSRLAVGLAAARLPRRGSCSRELPLLRAAVAPTARRESASRSARVRRPPGGDAAADAAGGLRRGLRPSPPLLPLPDLLRPRRHPQARRWRCCAFKQAYRAAGLRARPTAELPDHLCVVLEFAATVDREPGRRLLLDHRAGLELLRLALATPARRARRSSTRSCATLPPLRGDEREAVRRLAAAGPPDGGGRARAVRSPQFSPGASPSSPLPMPPSRERRA